MQTANSPSGSASHTPDSAATQSTDHAPTASPPMTPIHHFRQEDLDFFEADDTECGYNLGRILVGAFIYVMVGGTAVSLWTLDPEGSPGLHVALPCGLVIMLGVAAGWARAMLTEDGTDH